MTHPLDDLLDQTHRALLSGDLALLGRLAPLVEEQAFQAGPMEVDTANRLRSKAERNARLLQSALGGLRAARARFLDITGRGSLTTYDALGRKATVPQENPTSARRV